MVMPFCPNDPDETAEACVLGNLSDEQASLFAWHLARCPSCRRVLAFNFRYIAAIREAARRYLSAKSSESSKPKTGSAAG
jgi:anti-sigma factor RsiW